MYSSNIHVRNKVKKPCVMHVTLVLAARLDTGCRLPPGRLGISWYPRLTPASTLAKCVTLYR